MCKQIRLIQWQCCAQITQFLKFAQFGERRLRAPDRDRKSGMITIDAEEDQLPLVNEGLDLLPLEQQCATWVPADETLVPPDGHESRVIASYRSSQPVGILAPLATAIDECASKDVLVFHAAPRILSGQFTQLKLCTPGLRLRCSEISQAGQVL